MVTECFPRNLKELTGSRELLGININDMGRDAAVVKVIAQMFNLRFDVLWQRLRREEAKHKKMIIIGLIILIVYLINCNVDRSSKYQNKKCEMLKLN